MMEINKKKPQITSSETTAKTSNINGFQQLTITDEQRVKATPKRKAAGSNPVRGAKTPDIATYPVFYNFFDKIVPTNPHEFVYIFSKYSACKFSRF